MKSNHVYRVSESTVNHFANTKGLISKIPTLATHEGRDVVLMGIATFRMDEGPIWFALKTRFDSERSERLRKGTRQEDPASYVIVVDVI